MVKYHLGLQLESDSVCIVDVNCKKSGLGPIWGNFRQGRKFFFSLSQKDHLGKLQKCNRSVM